MWGDGLPRFLLQSGKRTESEVVQAKASTALTVGAR